MKTVKKVLALVLCMALCLSAVVCNLSVVADEPAEGTNLVSGLIPETFCAAYKYSSIRDGNDDIKLRDFSGSDKRYGYLPGDTGTKSQWNNQLAKLTDGSESTGVGIRLHKDNNDEITSGTTWVGVVFEFENSALVDSIVIKTDKASASANVDTHLFIADTYAHCFSDDYKVLAGYNNATITVNNINKIGNYFGLFSNDREFTINEIYVYGKFNMVSGKVPVTYSGTDTFDNMARGLNNYKLRDFSVSTNRFGYTPSDTTTKSQWNSLLTRLTDGVYSDTDAGVGLRCVYDGGSEFKSGWKGIIYQFDNPTMVDSIVIKTSNQTSGAVHMFVADAYNHCFNEDYKVGQVTNGATVSLSNVNTVGNYFALFTQDTSFTIYEISVFGSTFTEAVTVNDSVILNNSNHLKYQEWELNRTIASAGYLSTSNDVIEAVTSYYAISRAGNEHVDYRYADNKVRITAIADGDTSNDGDNLKSYMGINYKLSAPLQAGNTYNLSANIYAAAGGDYSVYMQNNAIALYSSSTAMTSAETLPAESTQLAVNDGFGAVSTSTANKYDLTFTPASDIAAGTYLIVRFRCGGFDNNTNKEYNFYIGGADLVKAALKGDLDDSGTLTTEDTTRLCKVILGLLSGDIEYTDVNSDTETDILDLVQLEYNLP